MGSIGGGRGRVSDVKILRHYSHLICVITWGKVAQLFDVGESAR